jgi:hypothetical protein
MADYFRLLVGIFCLLACYHSSAQVASYRIQRQKWLSQISTNPVPFAYRFGALVAGQGLVTVETRSSVTTNNLIGGSYQMSFGTNYPAYTVGETNLSSGLSEFNRFYPLGSYTLYSSYMLGPVPRASSVTVALTNDFPQIEPVFTNLNPLTELQATQTFSWPVFSTNPACFAHFVVLEGNIDTNILSDIINNGIQSVTNQLAVLAWDLQLSPAENQVTVTNLNPQLDHLAILQFYNANPTINDPLGLSEVSSFSANATFFFALRLLGEPTSQTVEEGSLTTLSTLAVGARPLRYQWYFNDAPLPGATNTLLVLQPTTRAHQGAYWVVVGNDSGSVTSTPAMLTVTNASPAPLQLGEEHVLASGTFLFLVSGEGTSYEIEYSTNLVHWSSLGLLGAPLGAAYYRDTNIVNRQPRRFYRARWTQ